MTDTPHIFSPAYYSRLAELEARHWWSLGLRATATRLLDRFAPRERNWRVLDVGCGTGLTLTWLKRYTDVEPIGLDVARIGLEFCARRGHRRLIEASALTLPFASDYFDLLVSMDVIQHLPRPRGDVSALAESARVLKPGGLFFLRTNSRCGYPQAAGHDFYRYSLQEIRTALDHAGFSILTSSYVNFLPGLLATVRQKLSGRNNSGADPGLRASPRPPQTNLVTQLLYRALLAEGAYLAASQRALPFGHSILALAEKRR